MDDFDIVATFKQFVVENPDVSLPVVAIKAMTEAVKHSDASTVSECMEQVRLASQRLKAADVHKISTMAGCDLFHRFITRAYHDVTNLNATKQGLIKMGQDFVANAGSRREKIADFALQFIKEDATILVHSHSRVVMLLLQKAAQANRRFTVLVTDSRPTGSGQKAVDCLKEAGIPASLILDAAVGYFMERVDMVLVGAEGIVENGGIINQVGTYQIAVVAKAANKPFYAVTECYKFTRLHPLNQMDLPVQIPLDFEEPGKTGKSQIDEGKMLDTPVDYTPPTYITLLFTDLGILTPAGVSDELIKAFY